MEKIEFFRLGGNLTTEPVNLKIGNDYKPLSQIKHDVNMFMAIYEAFTNNPKVFEIIKKMRAAGFTDRAEIVQQVIMCNFSELNKVDDIDVAGNVNPEYVECGYKGANRHCPFATKEDSKPYCIIKFKFQS